MRGTARLFVALAVLTFSASCQQAPRTALGPSALASSGSAAIEISANDRFGAVASPAMRGADTDAGFGCILGPFGMTDQSHATRSASGNETVVCTAKTTAVVAPDRAFHLEGFPCLLRFGPDGDPLTPDLTTDSKLVFTPSGHITLVCKSKA